jgi:energy-coupling factor transporter ATP-binding protein EcfA2
LTILSEIQTWSESLPAWQRHAVAVLYEKSELSDDDFEHVYALLKAAKGIPDPQERAHRALTAEQVAAPQASASAVQLVAIKELRGVNALASGKTVPLAAEGLTVIYGDNGVGKSGYSRVLKQACRARDRSEKIRGNAYVHPSLHERPAAKFDVLIDGAAAELSWTDGAPPPPELSALAIFDSRCARAYVDNQGDFAYAPYGLDILEGLAKVCAKLKERAARDQTASRPDVSAFARLAQSPTEAGRLAAALSAKTRKDDIERLATLSEQELGQIESLGKTLGEADPKKKANELRAKALRVEGLATRVAGSQEIVSDERIVALRALIEKSDNAKATARVAAKRFEDLDALEGTGGEAWMELFKAARHFCAGSPGVASFPHLAGDAKCPLCQNALGADGAARLLAFDEFIEGEAARAAKAAWTAVVVAFKEIVEAPLDFNLDEALRHDLEAAPELVAACDAAQLAARARRDSAREAATPDAAGSWDQITALAPSPVAALRGIVDQLREAAKKLDESMDAKARAAMEKQLAELAGRRQLSDLKAAALVAVDKFLLADKLGQCAAATATASISRKSTELTNTMATQEVANALMVELRALGVHEIKVAMKPSSARAKTTFKLVLETDGGVSPEDILSEGEQRAIAIASFLAEVRLGAGSGGIVFDDPVSSLDHARRERVARRLAREAKDRQVVVFTHDLFFLSVLMDEAIAAGSSPMALSLSRTPEGFGVAHESLPFAGAGVKVRVGLLRNKQVECARLRKQGDDAAYRLFARDLYNDLRMSWERGVEELLFNGAVVRFRKGVETGRLDKVVVTPDDLAAIEAGMTKCSNYTGHDGAMVANLAVPSPEDMTADIDDLNSWRETVTKRLNAKR